MKSSEHRVACGSARLEVQVKCHRGAGREGNSEWEVGRLHASGGIEAGMYGAKASPGLLCLSRLTPLEYRVKQGEERTVVVS